MQFKFSLILVDRIISNLRILKPSKATGLDKIPAKILYLSICIPPKSLDSKGPYANM